MRWKNRNHAVASEEIALIWVDDATIKKYDGAPPPREVEAKLVKALHQNGAKAIAFDFTFDMERNGTEDLTQVSKEVNRIIYGVALDEVDKKRDNLPPPLPRLTPFKINERNQAQKDNYVLERIPCQELSRDVKHLGHIMFRVSLDGAIRHIPLIAKIGERYYPALSLIAACLLKDVPLDGSGVTVKWGKYILLENKNGWKRKIPIDQAGRMRLNYIGGVDRFEQGYSFQNLERHLNTEIPQDLWRSFFANRLALIGNEANEADLTHTPFTRTFPGVAVHATAIDNILSGEFVREPTTLLTMFLSLCFSGVLVVSQLWLFHPEPQKQQRRYRFRVVIGFAIFSGFAIVYLCLAFGLFYSLGRFLNITLPLMGMLLAWIFVTNYCYVEQLRQEYIYRETIIKNMGNGLVVLDNRGRITTLNGEASQLLNLNEEQVLGKQLENVFGSDFPEMAEELTKALDLGTENTGRFPLKIAERELEVSLSYGDGMLDNPCRLIAVITDVTEVRNLERSLQLQQRRAVYSQLASELNHRIKNRLQTIRLDADKLMRRVGSNGTVKAIIERVSRQIVRLDKLATDFKRGISTYEHVKNGRWEEFDLNHIIESVLENASQSMNGDTQIQTQLSENLPPLRLEVDWIKDTLQNLVNNAIDAMPQGGQLTITTRILRASHGGLQKTVNHKSPNSATDKVLLTVRDTGEGIPDEDKPKIFTPWFTRKEEGSGMGLYMVQQVMQAHNGEIEFESQEGEGTEFRLFLPIRPDSLER